MSSSFLWAGSGIVFNNCALALNGTVSKLNLREQGANWKQFALSAPQKRGFDL